MLPKSQGQGTRLFMSAASCQSGCLDIPCVGPSAKCLCLPSVTTGETKTINSVMQSKYISVTAWHFEKVYFNEDLGCTDDDEPMQMLNCRGLEQRPTLAKTVSPDLDNTWKVIIFLTNRNTNIYSINSNN